MKAGIVARLGAVLALLAVCAFSRPASADVFVDLGVADTMSGAFCKKVQVSMGQKVLFRVSTRNTFLIPIVAVCNIPLLTVRVNRVVVPFRVNAILTTGNAGSTTLVAKCKRAGTFQVTAFVLFFNPFTGCFQELCDTAMVTCDDGGASAGTKNPSTDTAGGGQDDGTVGELGGG